MYKRDVSVELSMLRGWKSSQYLCVIQIHFVCKHQYSLRSGDATKQVYCDINEEPAVQSFVGFFFRLFFSPVLQCSLASLRQQAVWLLVVFECTSTFSSVGEYIDAEETHCQKFWFFTVRQRNARWFVLRPMIGSLCNLAVCNKTQNTRLLPQAMSLKRWTLTIITLAMGLAPTPTPDWRLLELNCPLSTERWFAGIYQITKRSGSRRK